jgi:hypothetical protein
VGVSCGIYKGSYNVTNILGFFLKETSVLIDYMEKPYKDHLFRFIGMPSSRVWGGAPSEIGVLSSMRQGRPEKAEEDYSVYDSSWRREILVFMNALGREL